MHIYGGKSSGGCLDRADARPVDICVWTDLVVCTGILTWEDCARYPRMSWWEGCMSAEQSSSENFVNQFHWSESILAEDEKNRLENLLFNYRSFFACGSDCLERTAKVEHKINMRDSCPVRRAPQRQLHSLRATIRQQTQEMLDQDVIQPSSSPWASPIVWLRIGMEVFGSVLTIGS